MRRANWTMILTSVAVAATLGAGGGWVFGKSSIACAGGSSTAVESMDQNARTATVKQAAQISPDAGPDSLSDSPALQLTLRPTAADSGTSFLVQVYTKVTSGSGESEPEKLLGTVSFSPLKVGESQDFVLPAPQQGFPSVAPQDIHLIVKLIPANPERSLSKAAVEIINAKFAE